MTVPRRGPLGGLQQVEIDRRRPRAIAGAVTNAGQGLGRASIRHSRSSLGAVYRRIFGAPAGLSPLAAGRARRAWARACTPKAVVPYMAPCGAARTLHFQAASTGGAAALAPSNRRNNHVFQTPARRRDRGRAGPLWRVRRGRRRGRGGRAPSRPRRPPTRSWPRSTARRSTCRSSRRPSSSCPTSCAPCRSRSSSSRSWSA